VAEPIFASKCAAGEEESKLVYAGYGLLVAASIAAHLGLSRRGASARLQIGLQLPLALGLVLLLASSSEPPARQLFEDLNAAYLAGARALRSDPASLYQGYSHGFVNLPIVAAVFVPLSFLSRGTAELVYTLVGVAAIVLAWLGLLRLVRASRQQAFWITLLLVANGPLYNSLREGNTTHLLLAVLVGALLCLERGREATVGALFAAIGFVKLPLLLLAAPFALRRRWDFLGGFAVASCGLLGLSLVLFGEALHWRWWHDIVAPSAGRPVGAFNVQSLDGLLARALTGAAHLRDWSPIEGLGPEFLVLRWLAVGLVLGAAFAACARAGAPRSAGALQLEIAIALCVALLVSPISWSHYYALLLLPLALCVAAPRSLFETGKLSIALLGFAALAISLPVRPVAVATPWLRELLAQWLVSHYVFGGLALLAMLLLMRARVGREVPEDRLLRNAGVGTDPRGGSAR